MKIQMVILGLLAASAIAPAQENGPSDRLFNPARIEVLEQESRDDWQKPDAVVEALGLRRGDVVADVGTGSGYFVPRLSRAVGESGRIYAVDVQPKMLAFVDQKIDRLGLSNVTTVLSEEDDTRLPEQSVDLILLVDVYHEVGAPAALLSNFRKILGDSGRLAIIDFKADAEALVVGPPLHHRVPRERLVAELAAAGFSAVEEHRFLPYQYFLIFARADGAGERNRGA